ncbi:helix-turn-helix domain-containing protein [Ekhidna sp.]
MDLPKTFGKEIKAYRQAAGLTQSQLAVKIDRDTDYISKIERGERVPSLTTLLEISNVLGFKLYDLMKKVDI